MTDINGWFYGYVYHESMIKLAEIFRFQDSPEEQETFAWSEPNLDHFHDKDDLLKTVELINKDIKTQAKLHILYWTDEHGDITKVTKKGIPIWNKKEEGK